MIELLAKNDSWAADGTFKSCPKPKIFKQSFIVGAMIKNRVITAVHALLPGKDIRYYQEAFRAIYDELGQQNMPKKCMIE